jgi:hypothetical protein
MCQFRKEGLFETKLWFEDFEEWHPIAAKAILTGGLDIVLKKLVTYRQSVPLL